MELILQTADQRIDGVCVEVPQLLDRGDLFGIAEKPVDQIIENTKPEQGRAPVLGRHSQDMLETSIDRMGGVHGNGDPAVLHVLNADNVEKKSGSYRSDALYHSRHRKPFSF